MSQPAVAVPLSAADHQRIAERLMEGTYKKNGPWHDAGCSWCPPAPEVVARAQVHATLALVALMSAETASGGAA